MYHTKTTDPTQTILMTYCQTRNESHDSYIHMHAKADVSKSAYATSVADRVNDRAEVARQLRRVVRREALLVHEQQTAGRARAVRAGEAMHEHAAAAADRRVDEAEERREELDERAGLAGPKPRAVPCDIEGEVLEVSGALTVVW